MTETEIGLEAMQNLVENAFSEIKAVDPVMLDVRSRTPLTDLMFFVSGNSTRHVKSIAEMVVEQAKEAGVRPLGVEGEEAGEWILVDLGEAVVHVMLPKVREFYRLERIWGVGEDEEEEENLLSGTH